MVLIRNPRGGTGGGGGATPKFLFGHNGGSISVFSDLFGGFWGNFYSNDSLTESEVTIPIDFAFRIRRLRMNLLSNTMAQNVFHRIRDDGVTVVSITILATTAGQFDTGDLSVDVGSGSEMNFNQDASAVLSGIGGSYSVIAVGQPL